MSTVQAEAVGGHGPDPVVDHDEEHGHSDSLYYKVAAILFVLTAIEIALPAVIDDGRIYGPGLIVLMGIKFFLVASFFMHLRFDNKLFGRFFYFGLVLAVIVYLAALSSMVYWNHSGTKEFDSPPVHQNLPAQTAPDPVAG